MSKPYLIVNVVEGKVGCIKQRDTWNEAVEIAVKLATEQCGTAADTIRAELEKDVNFVTPEGDIEVMIAQADDD